jgi:protein tyrosine/serine phosphatase
MGKARLWMRRIGLVTAVAAVVLAVHLASLYVGRNFHVVVPGEVYRSAQVSARDVAAYQKAYGIRSVLNLRGAAPGQAWYDEEVAAAERLGIKHVDFAMNASVEMGPDKAAELVALMRDMPKPLLVHCRHGSDRTGLAMALYLATVHNVGEEEAEGQLSLWYGHFAIPYLSDAWPMDRSWDKMETALGFSAS